AIASGSLLAEAIWRSRKASTVATGKNGGAIIAMRHSWPSGVEIMSPKPRTRSLESSAFGFGVPRLKRPITGYLPCANTCARDSSDPAPFASKKPVKQMPLAWLRRWPSGGPDGPAKPSTSFCGVRRSGENQPAVYEKVAATKATTPAIRANDPRELRGLGWGSSGNVRYSPDNLDRAYHKSSSKGINAIA